MAPVARLSSSANPPDRHGCLISLSAPRCPNAAQYPTPAASGCEKTSRRRGVRSAVRRIKSESALRAIATTRTRARRRHPEHRTAHCGHRRRRTTPAPNGRARALADSARSRRPAADSPASASRLASSSKPCRGSGRPKFHNSRPFSAQPLRPVRDPIGCLRQYPGRHRSRSAPWCRPGTSGWFVLLGSWGLPRNGPAHRDRYLSSRLRIISRQAGLSTTERGLSALARRTPGCLRRVSPMSGPPRWTTRPASIC